jgi:dynein heavy chain
LALNDYFTYYVYVNICRSLFEKHKLLFSFLLTVRILQGQQAIESDEWMFLISGKTLASAKVDNPAPDWIDNRMWSEICHLSTLSSFKGLPEDISSDLESWRSIYDSLEPHFAKLPGSWSDKDSFQRLCILRAIRADKVPDAVLYYVIEKMGKRFVEPPPFDLANCYKDASVLTPLVFVLSKGSGEWWWW